MIVFIVSSGYSAGVGLEFYFAGEFDGHSQQQRANGEVMGSSFNRDRMITTETVPSAVTFSCIKH